MEEESMEDCIIVAASGEESVVEMEMVEDVIDDEEPRGGGEGGGGGGGGGRSSPSGEHAPLTEIEEELGQLRTEVEVALVQLCDEIEHNVSELEQEMMDVAVLVGEVAEFKEAALKMALGGAIKRTEASLEVHKAEEEKLYAAVAWADEERKMIEKERLEEVEFLVATSKIGFRNAIAKIKQRMVVEAAVKGVVENMVDHVAKETKASQPVIGTSADLPEWKAYLEEKLDSLLAKWSTALKSEMNSVREETRQTRAALSEIQNMLHSHNQLEQREENRAFMSAMEERFEELKRLLGQIERSVLQRQDLDFGAPRQPKSRAPSTSPRPIRTFKFLRPLPSLSLPRRLRTLTKFPPLEKARSLQSLKRIRPGLRLMRPLPRGQRPLPQDQRPSVATQYPLPPCQCLRKLNLNTFPKEPVPRWTDKNMKHLEDKYGINRRHIRPSSAQAVRELVDSKPSERNDLRPSCQCQTRACPVHGSPSRLGIQVVVDSETSCRCQSIPIPSAEDSEWMHHNFGIGCNDIDRSTAT
eukprot:2224803-Rhodomonas_salina.1